jgi:hypothetical protein
MQAIRGASHDPWWDDGRGARRARTRRKIVGTVALGISIVACGLTTAAWIQQIFPSVQHLI